MENKMKRVLLHHNFKKESIEVKGKLMRKLIEANIDIVEENPDLVVVIGGDGTMLSAIRKMRKLKIPFVGINTGTLGFLPSFHIDEMDRLVEVIQEKSYTLQGYPLLKVVSKTINGQLIEKYAFNEVLIKHLEPRLMEAVIYIDKEEFNYFTGDGFIISTPIGATGYAIWAGGVAMHSDLPVYQLTPLSPNDNSVNRPLMSSLVLPIDSVIDINVIKSNSREVIVACDGLKVSNDYISEIHIMASHKEIQILRDKKYSYYDLYRRKIIDKNMIRGI
jgi:NAD+ kinase